MCQWKEDDEDDEEWGWRREREGETSPGRLTGMHSEGS
jgi:hypothetical protein